MSFSKVQCGSAPYFSELEDLLCISSMSSIDPYNLEGNSIGNGHDPEIVNCEN